MYMRDPEPEPAPLDSSPFGSAALVLSVVGVVVLGVFPGAVLEIIRTSAASLF
jgi:NADH:ubiquinone oxidoreductase subunit 2 (subunit N)